MDEPTPGSAPITDTQALARAILVRYASRERQRLVTWATRRMGAHRAADVEDIVQTAALRACEDRRSEARDDAGAARWTHGVLRKLTLCRQRDAARWRKLVSLSPDGDDPASDAPSPWSDPQEALLESETHAALGSMKARLAPQDREAIERWSEEDLTWEQLAEALGVTVAAARWRVGRALEALRAMADEIDTIDAGTTAETPPSGNRRGEAARGTARREPARRAAGRERRDHGKRHTRSTHQRDSEPR